MGLHYYAFVLSSSTLRGASAYKDFDFIMADPLISGLTRYVESQQSPEILRFCRVADATLSST
jgi:hypothetical protein